jgi:O-antigen/teichoic acid export membrane protein
MGNEPKSQLRIGIILNYLNIGLGALIPIFYTPVMLSLLGKSEYGLYKLSSSITGYLSLVSMGMGTAITRYIIKAREEEGKEAEERTFGLFLMLFRTISILTVIIGIVLICYVPGWYGGSLSSPEIDRMRILMVIMTANMALSFLLSPYVSVVTANERFVFMQSMSIITTCIIPLVNLIVLYLGFASIGMALSSLVIQFLIRFSYLYYSHHSLSIIPKYSRITFKQFKDIFRFSFWIFIGSVVEQLYAATDTALIGAVPSLGTNGVAVYNVGTVFSGIVLTIAVGISGMLTPRTNKMVFEGASNGELTDFAIRIGRIQAFIIGLIIFGFVSFGRPFIHFYVGDSYAESYFVALMIMIPYMIPIVQNVCLNIVVAKNRHRFRSIVYLIIAIFNVFGTWLLIRKIGVNGASLMTGLALVLGQGIIMNWFYEKRLGLDIKRFWRSILPIYCFPLLMSIMTLSLGYRIIDFYSIRSLVIGIMIFSIVYCVFNWFFMMNRGERCLVNDLIRFRW